MKLLPRRVPAEPADTAVDAVDSVDDLDVVSGKGRPTPKRRESTPLRGPVTAPKTRKEAYARQKQQAKEQRSVRKSASGGTGTPMNAQQRRQALRDGDPASLPRRDQGKTRKLARDYVDSRRMLSNYLLLLFLVLIVGSFVPVLAAVTPALLIIVIGEWYLVGRRIQKMAVERFGKAEGKPLGIGFYAGSRAYLPRRWRLPAPQVKRGDEI